MIFSATTSPLTFACAVVMPSAPLLRSRQYTVNGSPALASFQTVVCRLVEEPDSTSTVSCCMGRIRQEYLKSGFWP